MGDTAIIIFHDIIIPTQSSNVRSDLITIGVSDSRYSSLLEPEHANYKSSHLTKAQAEPEKIMKSFFIFLGLCRDKTKLER